MYIASTEIYLEELRCQFFNNDIQNRVKNLFEVPAKLWSEERTAKYNRLDQHITAFMLSSEKNSLKKKQVNYEWSPDLAAAGTELAYWLLLKRSHKRPVNAETLDTYRLRARLSAHSNLEGKALNKEIKFARKRLSLSEKKHMNTGTGGFKA